MKHSFKSKLIILIVIQAIILGNLGNAYCASGSSGCLGQAISLSLPAIHSGFKQAADSGRFSAIFRNKIPYRILSFTLAAFSLIMSHTAYKAAASIDYQKTPPAYRLKLLQKEMLSREKASYSIDELDKTTISGYAIELEGIATGDIFLSYAGPFIQLMWPGDDPQDIMVLTMFWSELLEKSFEFTYKNTTYSILIGEDEEIIITKKIDIKVTPKEAEKFKMIPNEMIERIPAWKIIDETFKASLSFKCRNSSYFIRLCIIDGRTKMLLLQIADNKIFDYFIDLNSLVAEPLIIQPNLSSYQLGISSKYSKLNNTYTFSFTELPFGAKIEKEKPLTSPTAKQINNNSAKSAIGYSI